MSKKKKNNQTRVKKQFLLILMVIIVAVSLGAIYTVIINKKDHGKAEIKANAATKEVEKESNENKNKNVVTTKQEDEQDNGLVLKGKNYSKVGQPFVDNVQAVQKMANTTKNLGDSKKVAYLTFDDGPSSKNTTKILDILKEENIKATFMILGCELQSDSDSELVKRMVREGHAIGNHSFSHNYNKLYPHGRVDVNTYMAEVEKTNNKLREILGSNFNTNVIRMPGGHMSWKGTAALDSALATKGYYYVDWDIMSGDAEGKIKSKQELINTFEKNIGSKQILVSLMHDSNPKTTTVQALPEIIKHLKELGYEFRTIGEV